MDDAHFGRNDDMDEDDEDEDDDVEMDFGEDTASDATSNTEEGEEDGLDNETHESTDAWDEGDDEDDDLIENEDDEGVDDEEDRGVADEGDDDGEEDMMWQVLVFHSNSKKVHSNGCQDIRGEIDGVRLGDEDMDDDDEHGTGRFIVIPFYLTSLTQLSLVPIQIIHEEDDEPDDMGSDEEDYALENGGPAEEQVFGFGDAFVNANNREGGGVFVHRRRGNGKLLIFSTGYNVIYNSPSRQRRLSNIWAAWKYLYHPTRGNDTSPTA